MSAWTLAFQFINFLVLAAVLRRFLFKPVAGMIKKRQEESVRALEAADERRKQAEQTRVQVETERESLRSEREQFLAQARTEVAKERLEILESAREEAGALRDAARRAVAEERRTAGADVAKEAITLGLSLAQRLLAQVAGSGLSEPFLESLSKHLADLSEERLRELRSDLDGGPLVIATTPAVGLSAQQRWSARLAEPLGSDVPVQFVEDATLVVGAELRFPHTKLSFCWRDSLETTREELVGHAEHR